MFNKNKLYQIPPAVLDIAENMCGSGPLHTREAFAERIRATMQYCQQALEKYEANKFKKA